MHNLNIENILKEIMSTENRDSISFEKLLSYKTLINDISNNYSNNEIEALRYLCAELGRNIESKIMKEKSMTEYRVRVDHTKYDRKNNIQFDVSCQQYLELTEKKIYTSSEKIKGEFISIPFYKNKYETIEPIYKKLDEICLKYEIVNKEEVEKRIEELTGIKRL
jgi:hypothetical protein